MAKRRFSNIEIARQSNDPFQWGIHPTYGGSTRISSKDKLLIERGGCGNEALDLYLDLLTDSQVYFCWDKQMSEITSKDWYVLPGGKNPIDDKVASYVEAVLRNLSCMQEDSDDKGLGVISNSQGFDGVTRGLGLSMITGVSYAEVVWYQDKEFNPSVKKVIIRDPRRFFFEYKEGKNYLKLLTTKNSFNGIFVPSRKFICSRYWSIPNDDLYGHGIGRLVYYPVQWRRELLTLWLTLLDKYSDPTIIGKYSEDVEGELLDEFKGAISSLSRDMYITMPNLFEVDFFTPDLGSVSLVENLEKVCNAHISKVILGEANTGEVGGGGVMRENVSNSIRLMKAKAFSDLLSETINNTLIKWITFYKFGGSVNPPTVWRNFDDVESKIELLNRMKTLGFNTTKEYIERLTGIPIADPAAKKSFGVSG